MYILILFIGSLLFSYSEGSVCSDYSVDKCLIESGSLIETLKDIAEYDCQFYCNVIYAETCKFYIYDRKQVICELLKEDMGDYVKSCSKYAGPPEPSVAKCMTSTDECKVYLFWFKAMNISINVAFYFLFLLLNYINLSTF